MLTGQKSKKREWKILEEEVVALRSSHNGEGALRCGWVYNKESCIFSNKKHLLSISSDQIIFIPNQIPPNKQDPLNPWAYFVIFIWNEFCINGSFLIFLQ
jgi:hypothetical protein